MKQDKEYRCMKITTYFYLPKTFDKKEMRYYMFNDCPGRVAIHDEHNQRKKGKMFAFSSLTDYADHIRKEWNKRVRKREKQSKK